jgi:hypothetical protein
MIIQFFALLWLGFLIFIAICAAIVSTKGG